MELVLVTHGSRAALEVGDVGIVVAHDEGPFELPGAAGIDAEIRAELHGTSHAFGDIDERAVAEDCGVECGKEVVAIGYDAAEVLAHQVGVFAHRLADGAEDDAFLLKFVAESRLDAHRVHHCIDGCSCQRHAFLQRDAQLVEGFHQLGVDVARTLFLLLLRGVSIVADGLIVYRRHLEVPPSGLFEREPVAVGIQAELEEPLRLSLLLGDESDDVLRESLLDDFRLYIGGEAVLVLLLRHLAHEAIPVGRHS